MLRESLPELLREFGFAADKANSLAIPIIDTHLGFYFFGAWQAVRNR
jgi:hypothetical protein